MCIKSFTSIGPMTLEILVAMKMGAIATVAIEMLAMVTVATATVATPSRSSQSEKYGWLTENEKIVFGKFLKRPC